MVLGRLFHYTFDAIMVSTVLAGVRRSSGFSPETTNVNDPTAKSVFERYLGVGETVFDVIQATAVNSPWFKKDSRR